MGRHQAPAFAYTPSTLPADHVLVRLGPPRGSNNFMCEDARGVERLVEMPAKVRRISYAARGSFVVVQLYDEAGAVAGEIVHVVSGDELKAWRRGGEWPKEFDAVPGVETAGDHAEDDDDDLGLPGNPNRRPQVVESSDDEDEESDDE